MAKATFETPDGDDTQIDAADVVGLAAGEEDETTMIELDDGSEVLVVATQLEVAAGLGLDPLEYIEPEDDDESIEGIVDES
jgi:hypothetical protein